MFVFGLVENALNFHICHQEIEAAVVMLEHVKTSLSAAIAYWRAR